MVVNLRSSHLDAGGSCRRVVLGRSVMVESGVNTEKEEVNIGTRSRVRRRADELHSLDIQFTSNSPTVVFTLVVKYRQASNRLRRR